MENIIIKNPSIEFDNVLNTLNDKSVYFIDTTDYVLRMQGVFTISDKFINIKKGNDRLTFLKESISEIKSTFLVSDIKSKGETDINEFKFKLLNGKYFSIGY